MAINYCLNFFAIIVPVENKFLSKNTEYHLQPMISESFENIINLKKIMNVWTENLLNDLILLYFSLKSSIFNFSKNSIWSFDYLYWLHNFLFWYVDYRF